MNLLPAISITSLAGLIRPERAFHAPHLLGHISNGPPQIIDHRLGLLLLPAHLLQLLLEILLGLEKHAFGGLRGAV
jgi:hypothetical protein